MKKTNDYEKGDSLPEINYTVEKPDETIIDINDEREIVEKKTKLTWDGRQFIARIPKAITTELNLTEGHELRFRITKFAPEKGKEPTIDMWFECVM